MVLVFSSVRIDFSFSNTGFGFQLSFLRFKKAIGGLRNRESGKRNRKSLPNIVERPFKIVFHFQKS